MNDIEKAKKLLETENLTLALVHGDKVYKSKIRGVKPMVEFISAKTDLSHFSAADKVVGKAAALLYVLSNVSEVFARVMTKEAKRIFSENGITAFCNETVDYIINRTKTDICPMEKTVMHIENPKEAFAAICKTLLQLEIKK